MIKKLIKWLFPDQKVVEFEYRDKVCPTCSGTGKELYGFYNICWQCDGLGVVRELVRIQD